jgi:hypothetical protein
MSSTRLKTDLYHYQLTSQQEMKGSNENLEKLTKQNLQSFVKRYERDKWLAAASRHYDLTGQRISPEAAKKMADQK